MMSIFFLVLVSDSASNIVWTGCTGGDVYDIDVVEASAPSVEFQFMTDSVTGTDSNFLGYLFTYYEVFSKQMFFFVFNE